MSILSQRTEMHRNAVIRPRLYAGLGATLLLAASVAQATVGPPVKIRMVPDPRPAAAGQQYTGVFEIHIGRAGTVADISIEGKGWTLQHIDRPPGARDVQPGVLRIPFRAMPTDANQPIRISLTYEGRRITRTFEIGPAYFARAGKALPLQRLPNSSGVRPAPPAEKGEPPAPQGAPPPSTVTVVGRLGYQRADGKFVGADRLPIQIRDEDPVDHDVMWSGLTDPDGYFDTGPLSTDVDGDGSGPDLVLYAETFRSGVVDVTDHDIDEATYTFETGETTDFEGNFLDYGVQMPISHAQIFHLFNTATRLHRYVADTAGIQVPEVQVIWPADETNSVHNCFFHEIRITALHGSFEDVLAHEYGHHFECSLVGDWSNDYCNQNCDEPDESDCGHCIWCDEGQVEAWHEGFADWFGGSAVRSFARDYEFDDGCPYDPPLRSNNYNFTAPLECSCPDGDDCDSDETFTNPLTTEGYVGLLLRDIDDDVVTNCLGVGPGPILNTVVTAPGIQSVQQFIGFFGTFNPALRPGLWQTANNVDPVYVNGTFPADTQPPGAVIEVGSPTHPLGEGGPLPCVTVQWRPPDDDVTGAAAYSYIWSASPTGDEPDMTADVQAICGAAAASRPIFPNQQTYIRVRAQDAMGNWGPSSAWFGPFVFSQQECPLHANIMPDVCEINCNVAEWPIACEIPADPFLYCGSFVSLDCETHLADCNANAAPDDCDLADGASQDCNADGVPDECQALRYWINPTGGSWHVAENWDSQPPPPPDDCAPPPPPGEPGLPQSTENVCINTGNSASIFHTAAASNIASMNCHDNLLISGSALTLGFSQPSRILGNLQLSGNFAVLTVNNHLDIYGLFTWTGSGSSNAAKLAGDFKAAHARGGLNISGNVFLDGLALVLDDQSSGTSTGRINLQSFAGFRIRPGSTFEHQGSSDVMVGSGNEQFLNEGTFIKSVDTGTRFITVRTQNDGLIHVQSGGLRFTRSTTGSGSWLADPGTLLRFDGATHDFLASSSIAAPEVQFESGTTGNNFVRGTYNVTGTTRVNSTQPLTFTNEAQIISYGPTFLIPAGTVDFDAVVGGPIHFNTLTVGTPISIAGTARFNSGDPVDVDHLTNGPGTIGGSSNITINNLLTWKASGHFSGTGVVNVNGDTIVEAGSGQKTFSKQTLNNAGNAVFLGGFNLQSTAVFSNLASAVMDIQAAGTILGLSPSAILNNAGTLVKSAGTGTSFIAVNFHNTGLLHLQSGNLQFSGNFNMTHTQTAGETFLDGGSLELTSGMPFNMLGGRLRGAGTVTGNVNNTGGSVEPGASAGILNVTGNYTNGADGTLKIELGGLTPGSEHDQLVVSGSADLQGGTVAVAPTGGFIPQVGQQFVILTAGTVQGAFSGVTGPGSYTLTHNPANVTLTVTQVPCAQLVGPDFDFDCDVDAVDVLAFINCDTRSGVIVASGCEPKDLDGDLDADLADFGVVQRCYSGDNIEADATCDD